MLSLTLSDCVGFLISLVVKCQEPILNWQRQKVEFADSWSPGKAGKLNHRKGKNGAGSQKQ